MFNKSRLALSLVLYVVYIYMHLFVEVSLKGSLARQLSVLQHRNLLTPKHQGLQYELENEDIILTLGMT